jgi:hypothetical protein
MKRFKSRYGSSSVIDLSFTISNYGEWNYRLFTNLKFQKIDSDSIHALTDKPALILTATYLSTVSEEWKTNYGVHCDVDTNRDGKLDTSDIKSLYLSDISGKKFH